MVMTTKHLGCGHRPVFLLMLVLVSFHLWGTMHHGWEQLYFFLFMFDFLSFHRCTQSYTFKNLTPT
jgi:hypothetical protein